MTSTLSNGIKVHEFMDEPALEWLRIYGPELEQVMIDKANKCPVYDGKEVIVFQEFFLALPPAFAMVSYVHGNDDPKDNGWALRIFEGVQPNSDEYFLILKGFEKMSNCPMVMENE